MRRSFRRIEGQRQFKKIFNDAASEYCKRIRVLAIEAAFLATEGIFFCTFQKTRKHPTHVTPLELPYFTKCRDLKK